MSILEDERLKQTKNKRLISLMLAVVLMVSFSVPINANSETENTVEMAVNRFESIDDETGLKTSGYPVFDGAVTLDNGRAASGTLLWQKDTWAGATLYTKKAISTGDATIRKEFVKYLTSSWAKASSYTWSNSVTVGWSLGGGLEAEVYNGIKANLQLSSSRTTTYAVETTIGAIDSMFSKLGFASNFFVQNFKCDNLINGVFSSSSNGSIKSPTIDTYLIVYYQ